MNDDLAYMPESPTYVSGVEFKSRLKPGVLTAFKTDLCLITVFKWEFSLLCLSQSVSVKFEGHAHFIQNTYIEIIHVSDRWWLYKCYRQKEMQGLL